MIEILRITAPFGIKGAVRVVLFTDNIKHYKRLFDSAGNEIAFKVLQDKVRVTTSRPACGVLQYVSEVSQVLFP